MNSNRNYVNFDKTKCKKCDNKNCKCRNHRYVIEKMDNKMDKKKEESSLGLIGLIFLLLIIFGGGGILVYYAFKKK